MFFQRHIVQCLHSFSSVCSQIQRAASESESKISIDFNGTTALAAIIMEDLIENQTTGSMVYIDEMLNFPMQIQLTYWYSSLLIFEQHMEVFK